MSRAHHTDYDEATTARCERALVTLLGDETPEAYRTLQSNLEKAGFRQGEPSFRWLREVDGVNVIVEFLCETDEVEPGRIFRPKGEGAGSKVAAFSVRGAHLARDDYIERRLEGERLDGGGQSMVTVRIANFLPYKASGSRIQRVANWLIHALGDTRARLLPRHRPSPGGWQWKPSAPESPSSSGSLKSRRSRSIRSATARWRRARILSPRAATGRDISPSSILPDRPAKCRTPALS